MALAKIENSEDFKGLVEQIEQVKGYKRPMGFGIARVDRGQKNREKILQTTYPVINWNENFGSAAVFVAALEEAGVEVNFSASESFYDVTEEFLDNVMALFYPFLDEAVGSKHKNVQAIKLVYEAVKREESFECAEYQSGVFIETEEFCLDAKDLKNFKIVFLFEDKPVKSVESAYLKLYALSQGKAELRSLNLDGVFGILENVAWCGNMPIELEWLRDNEISLKLEGMYPEISSVDKFPRFLQHVIPADNTRILESSKVRIGAQLHAGTTVMSGASYINFNAGTTGPVMVEGRISSSAIVGSGSDVGGGASILGVLSGTDGNPISIGENTLLGANSVTGIPLGNACIIDAGVTILGGTRIFIKIDEFTKIVGENIGSEDLGKKAHAVFPDSYIFKGESLAGLDGVHFRQNSVTGQITAFRSVREVKLNEDLH